MNDDRITHSDATRTPASRGGTKARITRPVSDRLIAGVCAAIGRHFGWDSTRVRIGYVVLSILSAAFPGILLYLILWFVIPSEPREPRSLQTRLPVD
jgi:phage shock protein C